MTEAHKAKIMTDGEICSTLSITKATLRNWIRLGKLVQDSPYGFSYEYIQSVVADIRSGKRSNLKSRRNKKSITGKLLYKDYILSRHNHEAVGKILSYGEITDSALILLLANCALDLYMQSRGMVSKESNFFDKLIKLPLQTDFTELLLDLLECNKSKSKTACSSVAPSCESITGVYNGVDGHIDRANAAVRAVSATTSSAAGCSVGAAVQAQEVKQLELMMTKQLRFVAHEDTLGFLYLSLKDIGKRKADGAYYTPHKIVHKLLNALKKVDKIQEGEQAPSFFDPCCGSGNFLIALQEIYGDGAELYGQDIDPISVCLARITLYLNSQSLSVDYLRDHIKVGDSLMQDFAQQFDVIVGNPPWGSVLKNHSFSSFCAKFQCAQGSGVEAYDLFIEKSLSLLKSCGTLSLVLPEAMLHVASHEPIRKLLMSKCSFNYVAYLGDVFSGVQCPSIILQVSLRGQQTHTMVISNDHYKGAAGATAYKSCSNKDGIAKCTADTGANSFSNKDGIAKCTADTGAKSCSNKDGIAKCTAEGERRGLVLGCRVEIGDEAFTIKKERALCSKAFAFNLSDDDFACIEAIESLDGAEFLKGQAQFALGIVTGNNKELLHKSKEDGFEPILKGSDIYRYSIHAADNFIRFEPERFQQLAPKELYRAHEKLCYRFICKVPVFAYDNEQRLSLNSCNILIPHIPGLTLKYVLAILNSGVVAFYVAKKFNSVKLLRSHIEQIPIPRASAAEQCQIESLVECMICSDGNCDKVALFAELDSKIAALYKLKPSHRAMIERFVESNNLFF